MSTDRKPNQVDEVSVNRQSDVDEKEQVSHLETAPRSNDPKVAALQDGIEALHSLSQAEYDALHKRLVRKIDTRLLPVLFVLLILNYLDRNALASARVQGLEEDLGMEGNQFNIAVSVLFVGYILGQIPSNLILSRVRPSLYLSLFVALWGAVSTCTAAADNFHHLVVLRFFLGVTEAPYFPGALFLLSAWYTKKARGPPRMKRAVWQLADGSRSLPLVNPYFRTSILYTGSLLSGAFSGLITAGIQGGMDGLRGLAAWRWLFIVEGGITVLAALLSLFILPDYPATTRWLSIEEKAIAVYRLEKDTGVKDEETLTLFGSFKAAVTDYKLWVLALIIITKTTAGAVTQFVPTVVATFGMSKVHTLLLTAPPYLVAAVLALIISRTSDRRPERCFHLLTPLAFGMVGFIVAVATTKTAPRYFSLFLMIGGMFGSYNVALAWISSTFARPRAKRAAAYATINSLGNIAQIWSPYLYDKKYSPQYRVAFATNTVMAAIAVCTCVILRYCLLRENKAMDNKEREARNEEELGLAQKQIRYVL